RASQPTVENHMHTRFERTGPLTELGSYPQWAQDMVADCEQAKQGILGHEVWARMSEARLDPASTRNFMVGVWPVIERFPAYMAHNLLKTRYGRSPGDNLARRWPRGARRRAAAATWRQASWPPITPWREPPANGRSGSLKAPPTRKACRRRDAPGACVGFNFTRPMTILILGRRWRSSAPWSARRRGQTRSVIWANACAAVTRACASPWIIASRGRAGWMCGQGPQPDSTGL